MLISAMHAHKLLAMGAIGYLASVVDKEKKKENIWLANVPIICNYQEVFQTIYEDYLRIKLLSSRLKSFLGRFLSLKHPIEWRKLN